MTDTTYRQLVRCLNSGEYGEVINKCLQTSGLNSKGDLCYLLGLAYEQKDDMSLAQQYLARSMRLSPNDFLPVFALAQLYRATGKSIDAVYNFEKSISINPDAVQAHYELGLALMDCGKLTKACESFQACFKLQNDHVGAKIKFGTALVQLGKYQDAIEVLLQAAGLAPDEPVIYSYLGYAYEQSGDYEKAEEFLQVALNLRPESPEAHNNLGNILKVRGKAEVAVSCFRQALALQSNFSGAYSNLLLCMNYVPSVSLSEMFFEHTNWATEFACTSTKFKKTIADTVGKKIRVGYVSPDFRNHPVANFFLPIITHHDKQKFEIYCYAEVASPDNISNEIATMSDQWINTCGMSDSDIAEKVSTDKIDILVDLAGHTGGNRLGVFALKPAAIQITYLGYPNTTGLKAIDYRITDNVLDPLDSEQFYTEKLYRIASGFSCYQPPRFYPDLEGLPLKKNGYITFGSFNNPAKFNEQTFSLWSRVLAAVSNSRLLLYRNVFIASEKTNVMKLCVEHGIDENRVIIMDRPPADKSLPPSRRYLRVMSEVDICLDTFPWSGHTTACEALWMGVPVVTLSGDRPSSRLCSSVLRQLELSYLSATTEDGYVEIAANLAKRVNTLNELRCGLRQKMRSSIVCNGGVFTRSLETFYISTVSKN